MLSVILPAYNEAENIKRAAKRTGDVLKEAGIEYELVYVNDGSTDETESEIESLADTDSHVRYVMFSRNFGKEAAISAGLAHSKGDCVAVMDCDLQHPPETLPRMYKLWEDGYEVVEGVKSSRGKESVAHKAFAGFFYGIMSKAMDMDMRDASDFKLLDRRAVEAVLSFPEYHSFFRALSSFVGFKKTKVDFEVQEREAGKSKWSLKALFFYAMDNIMEFSAVPMHIVTFTGIITFIFAIALGIQTLIRYFDGTAAEGFTTVIILLLFLGSILMISLGIIGMYISKIYDEVKHRPRYIISKCS